MRNIANKIIRFSSFLGIDIWKQYTGIKGFFGFYLRDYKEIKKQIKNNNCNLYELKKYPILRDKYSMSGVVSGDYFHQDLLVAQLICKNKPDQHLDIGSRVDGFVAHVASFRPIEVLDIRPLICKSRNISFRQADLMNECNDLFEKYDSISSLHAIEHFGLGRYGDKIDLFGSEKGLKNISKLLKKGGKFYFSVPIGPQRIEFNAHRVFSIKYLLELFQGIYNIDSFSYVDDSGDLFDDVKLTESGINENYGCTYGCGIFEMTKL